MDRIDLIKVYTFASAMWSSFKMPKSEIEAKYFDEVWFTILKPYPLEMILTAMQEYATESDFCNIAKIADLCKTYTQKANGTYIDVERVLTEIRNAVSYDKNRENFEKLSPFAKEIVQHPAYLAKWAKCEQFETVILSNLRKQITNTLAERKHNEIMQLTVGNKKLLT